MRRYIWKVMSLKVEKISNLLEERGIKPEVEHLGEDLESFIGQKFNYFGEVLQSVSHRIEYQNGGGLLATCYDKYICEF